MCRGNCSKGFVDLSGVRRKPITGGGRGGLIGRHDNKYKNIGTDQEQDTDRTIWKKAAYYLNRDIYIVHTQEDVTRRASNEAHACPITSPILPGPAEHCV